MPRFFIDPLADGAVQAVIHGEDARHIQRVLRMQKGEALTLCDGCGWEYSCVLERLEKDKAVCSILARNPSVSEPRTFITLFQGLPKAGKMEIILQKCVELGVSAFYPMDTERTVVRMDQKDTQRRTERWQRVAEEAAKQSGRGRIPQVHPLMTFHQALAQDSSDLRILLWEQECSNSLRSVLAPLPRGMSISLIVGPEGGIAGTEADYAAAQGVVSVTLGPRILRTETAGMAAAAAILYQMEEME